jgi:hypothetical protein
LRLLLGAVFLYASYDKILHPQAFAQAVYNFQILPDGFIGALVFNQIRGLDIHCGCFSTDPTAGPANLWTVGRDLFFFMVSLYLSASVLFFRSPPEMPARRTAGCSNS